MLFYTLEVLAAKIILIYLKLVFSKKATKIDEIFTVDLTECSKRQINGEDFANFCVVLRKYEHDLSTTLDFNFRNVTGIDHQSVKEQVPSKVGL